jgi:hypothetical protein
MCRHYLPDKRPYCADDRTDPPVEKAVANFCDFFAPANRFQKTGTAHSEKAKSELDDLFGEASNDPDELFDDSASDTEADPDDPKNKLDDLFDD